jgi:hypothetical protein
VGKEPQPANQEGGAQMTPFSNYTPLLKPSELRQHSKLLPLTQPPINARARLGSPEPSKTQRIKRGNSKV